MTNKIAIEYLKDMLASAEANLHVPDMAEHAEALNMAIEALEGKDIDVPSRKGVFIPDITVEMFRNASLEGVEELMASGVMEDVSLPSAQPEPFMKAVWTWLLHYQIKMAELKGRYTPYEVLSWVATDWRKEYE